MSLKYNWVNLSDIASTKYVCGYCGSPLASNKGYSAIDRSNSITRRFIYICHQCEKPTFFDENNYQTPGAIYGNKVNDISISEIERLYEEARKCISCNAYTASVLCCRKLLMNIAVAKTAKEGQSFIEYVQFLSDKGFVPPDGKEWVDHIRKKGNEATHEISIMKKEDAEELIDFIEMILKFIYEFPAIIKRKGSSQIKTS